MPHFQTQIKMIQHFARVMRTASHRLMYRVFMWDRQLNASGQISSWSSEIKSVLYEHNLNSVFDNQQIFVSKDIVGQLKVSMNILQRQLVQTECESKPKLRTFVTFKDYQTLPPHVCKPLSFLERIILSKVRLETARYLRPALPENELLS